MGLVSLHSHSHRTALRIRSVSVWFAFSFLGLGFSDRFGLVGFGLLFPCDFPICIRLSAGRKWKMAIALALKPAIAAPLPPAYNGHCQF